MPRYRQFAITAIMATLAAPIAVQAESVYAEMIVEDSVNQNIECAATIFALGDGAVLATMIATFFVEDATDTLTALGGADDREEASLSVQSKVAFRAEDIQLSNTSPDQLEQAQFDCVMARFQD
jgi:hypothetical protein